MVLYCSTGWQPVDPTFETCQLCRQPIHEPGTDFLMLLLSSLRQLEPTRAGVAIDILVGQLCEPCSVELLIALLANVSDPLFQAQAARGLGQIGNQAAVLALAQLLNNGEAPLPARQEAAQALGRLGGPEAESALFQALIDPRPAIEDAAWEALRRLASRAATSAP